MSIYSPDDNFQSKQTCSDVASRTYWCLEQLRHAEFTQSKSCRHEIREEMHFKLHPLTVTDWLLWFLLHSKQPILKLRLVVVPELGSKRWVEKQKKIRSGGGGGRNQRQPRKLALLSDRASLQWDDRKVARCVPGMSDNNKIYLFVLTCGSETPVGEGRKQSDIMFFFSFFKS